MTDKFCTKCGRENMHYKGDMNYNPKTGEPRNHWWEVKCPAYAHLGEFGGNGHYYEYGSDVKRYPEWIAVLILVIVLAFLLYECTYILP